MPPAAELDPRVWFVLVVWGFLVASAAVAMALYGRRRRRGDAVPGGPDPGGADPDGARAPGGFWAKFSSYLCINVVFLFLAWTDYVVFSAAAVLLSFTATYEVASQSRACREGLGLFSHPLWYAASAATVAGVLAQNDANLSFKTLVGMTLLHALTGSFGGALDLLVHRSALSALAVVYIPLCLVSLVYLKLIDPSGFIVVFVYMVTGAADSFAQVCGRLLGRRQLAPILSPGKTVEGFAGGIVCAALAALLLRPCLPYTPMAWVVAAGLYLGVTAAVGDLIKSSWKRVLGIKDFSRLLGAHGGVTDRFDSLMLGAAAFFLVLGVIPPSGLDSKGRSPTLPLLGRARSAHEQLRPAGHRQPAPRLGPRRAP